MEGLMSGERRHVREDDTNILRIKRFVNILRFNWQLQWVSGVSLRCEDESEMTEMVSRGK